MRDLAVLILSIGASTVMVIGILLISYIAYRTLNDD
jgi:hypothetical protein